MTQHRHLSQKAPETVLGMPLGEKNSGAQREETTEVEDIQRAERS